MEPTIEAYNELVEKLLALSVAYYDNDAPLVSDFEYDMMNNSLKRHLMGHGGKGLAHVAAHVLGGRVGPYPLRVGRLHGLQLVVHPVILKVGHQRRVVVVIGHRQRQQLLHQGVV